MDRPRTTCPTCGRDVAFTTDLVSKFLARHTAADGRWCPARIVPVASLDAPSR